MSTAPAAGGRVGEALPGLALCLALATAAFLVADHPFVKDGLHVSALLLVILAGMAVRSFVALPEWAVAGVRVAQRPVLRWAVAGLGFRLSLGEIAHIGGQALVVVVVSTAVALAFGVWVGRRLGLEPRFATLLSVGGGICGASAVVAADSVVQAEKRDSALALGVITLLGTIGIVTYPWIGRAFGMSDLVYGVWDGASLHEMAQVVAAGAGFSDSALRTATTAKLVRITLLAPVVFLLAWQVRQRTRAQASDPTTKRPDVPLVPWFLVLFVAFAALNSTGLLEPAAVKNLQRADTWLLCVGMAGVGLQTSFTEIRRAGLAPIAAGAAQWLLLALLSGVLATLLCR